MARQASGRQRLLPKTGWWGRLRWNVSVEGREVTARPLDRPTAGGPTGLKDRYRIDFSPGAPVPPSSATSSFCRPPASDVCRQICRATNMQYVQCSSPQLGTERRAPPGASSECTSLLRERPTHRPVGRVRG